MLTPTAFQTQYHAYRTADRLEACRDSLPIQLTEGRVVPVQVGDEYTLMLETAATYAAELGLVTLLDPLADMVRAVTEG